MSNKDMKLDVLIRLKDQLTGGLNRMTAGLDRVTSAARRIGAVGAIIAGISFMGPMQSAAAFEQQLIDIAGTAELTGGAAFKFVDEAKTRYEKMALQIGQSSATIAAGAGKMIAAGVDVTQVEASLEAIGRAATAANADFDDMAGVAVSLLLNLKLPAEEMEDALGALVAAGKLGSFELKDMAKEFPNLTSQVAKFGVEGREAVNFLGSGLQIAMKGAAQTSVAANNFSNFLAKALAPRVVKNFDDMGVDIQAVMMDAAAKGINPLEAVLQKVQVLTGVSQSQIEKYMGQAKASGLEGAEALGFVRQQLEKIGAAGKLTSLFNDQSVLEFLIPMLANVDEYLDIKQQVAKATGAMTDADFETQMQGVNRQMTILSELGSQFSREWGLAFGGWLPMVNDWLGDLLGLFRQWDAATGGVLKQVLSFGAGLTLLAVGLGAVGLVLPLVTAGFGAIAAVAGLVLSPIGLVVGLLAGAGVLIWQNWDKVAPKLKAFWGGIKDVAGKAWDGIKSAWSKVSPYMSQIWGKMTDAAGRAWNFIENQGTKAWEALKSGAAGLFSGIDWDGAGLALVEGYDATVRALGATWEWLGQVWDGFAPSLASIGESLQSAFGSLGGVWENIKGIGAGFIDLATGIGKLLGLGDGTGEGIAVFLGQFAGGLGALLSAGVAIVADSLQIISGAIRTLLDLLNGRTPDWAAYFPSWVVETVGAIGSAIGVVIDGIKWLWDNDPNGQGGEPDWTNPETYRAKDPVADLMAAHERTKLEAVFDAWERESIRPPTLKDVQNFGLSQPMAAHALPLQRLDVDVNTIKSEITVRYDGPLRGPEVISATTTANTVSDGGLAVGRP